MAGKVKNKDEDKTAKNAKHFEHVPNSCINYIKKSVTGEKNEKGTYVFRDRHGG